MKSYGLSKGLNFRNYLNKQGWTKESAQLKNPGILNIHLTQVLSEQEASTK